jgi:hypothetical protein
VRSAAKIIDMCAHREDHPGRACFEDVRALFKWLDGHAMYQDKFTREEFGGVAKKEFGERGFQLFHDLNATSADYSLPHLKGRWTQLGSSALTLAKMIEWSQANG